MKTLWGVVLALGLARAAAAQDTPSLEDRVGKLEKAQEAGKGSIDFTDGLKFKSDTFEARIGGRFIEHFRLVENQASVNETASGTFPRQTGFLVREARLDITGLFIKEWEFKVQTEFGTGSVQLKDDAYIGWKRFPEFAVRIGEFKMPFSGTEEVTSTLFIPCCERTTGNRLVPSQDIGIKIYGKLFEMVGYEAAYYNGGKFGSNSLTGPNPAQSADQNNGKDVALRLSLFPIHDGDFKGLMLAAAGTTGRISPIGGGLADINTRQTETRVIDFAGSTVGDGDRKRLGFEVQFPFHQFGVEGEWYRTSMDLLNGASSDTIAFTEFYVTGTWIVTGETKKIGDRIRPDKPFDIGEHHFGAAELHARFGRFSADNKLVDNGYALSGTTTLQTDEYTFGVNWWPIGNVRWTVDFIYNRYGDTLTPGGDSIDNEKTILMRFQVDF